MAKTADLKLGARVALQATFALVALTILKGVVGYMTNTVVLLADAVGSFGDIFAMLAIYVGLLMSQREATKKFRYGFHRIETLVSFMVALFMIYLGYEILIESAARIMTPRQTFHSTIGIITALISVAASTYAHIRIKRVAVKINSSALLTSAIDKKNDAFVSGGVFVAIVANTFSIPYIEGAIGVLIALMILYAGTVAAKSGLLYLLDYWDDPEIPNQIRKILKKSKLITGINSIRLRHAGTFIFGEALVEVSPFIEMKDFRDEMHRLNAEIAKEVKHVGDFVIYVDPPKPNKVRVAIPVERSSKLSSKIAHDFTKKF